MFKVSFDMQNEYHIALQLHRYKIEYCGMAHLPEVKHVLVSSQINLQHCDCNTYAVMVKNSQNVAHSRAVTVG